MSARGNAPGTGTTPHGKPCKGETMFGTPLQGSLFYYPLFPGRCPGLACPAPSGLWQAA